MSNILITDDESTCKSVGSALSKHGHSVDVASDGDEALRKLQEKTFNLLLISLCIPGLDGIEILKQAHKHSLATAVVVMTPMARSRAPSRR